MTPDCEVSPKRLAEFKAIEKEVDERAAKLTRQKYCMPDDQWWDGVCYDFWDFKKRILLEEYHMRWRSPADLNPHCIFD